MLVTSPCVHTIEVTAYKIRSTKVTKYAQHHKNRFLLLTYTGRPFYFKNSRLLFCWLHAHHSIRLTHVKWEKLPRRMLQMWKKLRLSSNVLNVICHLTWKLDSIDISSCTTRRIKDPQCWKSLKLNLEHRVKLGGLREIIFPQKMELVIPVEIAENDSTLGMRCWGILRTFISLESIPAEDAEGFLRPRTNAVRITQGIANNEQGCQFNKKTC